MDDAAIFAHPFEVPCPHCGTTGLQLIGDLINNDEIACRACGGMIDLTSEEWRSGLIEMIEGLRHVSRIPLN